jgi:hypothetical protein
MTLGEGGRRPTMRILYTTTILLGALLVFLVQPMVGKLLLPRLGGTPAVWNTCMVFFQVALLAGYAYAHLLARLRDQRAQTAVHALFLVVAAVSLPVTVVGDPPEAGWPVGWLLWTLLGAVGLPFVALAAGGPLLQRWFATTDDRSAHDPYFLYAASNTGSLAALLGFPLLVEPLIGSGGQSAIWSIGYLALVALTVACGIAVVRRRAPVTAAAETVAAKPPARPRDYLYWIALAFVPSSLMLGATQHITTDVAAVPLFWVVPLAIYLLTFILAYARHQVISAERANRLLVIIAVPALAISILWWNLPIWLMLALHLGVLFIAAMACHARLAATRPDPRHLTGYFLAIATGGALGGVFNSLIAPVLFETVVEYPLAIALALLLRQRGLTLPGRPRLSRMMSRGLDLAVIAMTLAARPFYSYLPDVEVLARTRSFFGVHCVADTGGGRTRVYYQGTTLHGVQVPTEPGSARGYYHEASGIGRLLRRLEDDPRLDRVGLVGLGAGALAAYAQPGQRFTFFEIDPAVVRIAQDPSLFTYLSDMPQQPRIVVGDGRLSLAREPDGSFGLIVLDAFSSDAIPVHLLTREAFDLYFRKLAPGGLLTLHATNRHVDLGRLVSGMAAAGDLAAVEYLGAETTERDVDDGMLWARWFAIARGEGDLAPLRSEPGWAPVTARPDDPVWTDDFSNVLGVLNWRR